MNTPFPKRLAIYLSLVLTTGILTPSVLGLAHALHGHSEEKHCTSPGTTHIHEVGFDCDFQDLNILPKVFLATTGFHSHEIHLFEVANTIYVSPFVSNQKKTSLLRGPPCVS